MPRSVSALVSMLCLAFLAACHESTLAPPATNTTPPTASAGTTQHVTIPTTVTLDGSASTSADGGSLSYAWTLTTIPTGSSATLTGANTVSPTFTPDVPGNYVAQLVVSEGSLTSTTSSVTVGASGTVNLLVNGSFESGMSNWTSQLQLAPGATGTGGFNVDVAPGTETLTSTAGLPASDGTHVALGSVQSTTAGGYIVSSVLYQDVALPANATTTATFSFHAGAKGGTDGVDNGYKVAIYPTTSVPGWSTGSPISPTVMRVSSVVDTSLQLKTSSSFDFSSRAGQTVRFAIINACENNTGEVVVFDDVRFDVMLHY